MFQPAEELLAGAKDMIEHGLLENPRVDAGIGLHISVGGGEDTAAGKISYKPGVANFSGDAIKVTFTGKDAHGSTPQKGVDAINIAAHAVIALQEILAREVAMDDRTMVLVGTIHGGSSCNTLSGSCAVEISVRAADREMRAFLKERVKEICEGTAATFRGKAEVEFVYGMPSLYNDPAVCEAVSGYCAELFGAGDVIELTGLSGTEDFTAVAEQIPAAMFHLGVGSIAEGPYLRRPQPEDDRGRVGAVPGRCPLCLLRRPLPGRAPGLIPGPAPHPAYSAGDSPPLYK